MSSDDPGPDDPLDAQHPPSRRAWLRDRAVVAGRWLRAHSTHALLVALVAAVVPVLVDKGLDWASHDKPPSCPGAGCDGRNKPACAADALTFEPTRGNPARLQIRYSAYCGAVWGRVLAAAPGDQVTIHVQGGSSQAAKVNIGTDQFTPLATVGSTFRVEACAVASELDPHRSHWHTYCRAATQDDFGRHG